MENKTPEQCGWIPQSISLREYLNGITLPSETLLFQFMIDGKPATLDDGTPYTKMGYVYEVAEEFFKIFEVPQRGKKKIRFDQIATFWRDGITSNK